MTLTEVIPGGHKDVTLTEAIPDGGHKDVTLTEGRT